VTSAYFALITLPVGQAEAPIPGAPESQWVEVEEARRKRLAFDHTQILAVAVARLRSKVEYTSLPAFLLTEPFTLPQLQQTYEVVLGREVDKSAFRKRMLDAAFLEEVGVVDGVFGRAATGYRITGSGAGGDVSADVQVGGVADSRGKILRTHPATRLVCGQGLSPRKSAKGGVFICATSTGLCRKSKRLRLVSRQPAGAHSRFSATLEAGLKGCQFWLASRSV
jgi:hypothetical protein